jgi:hypothetical protein
MSSEEMNDDTDKLLADIKEALTRLRDRPSYLQRTNSDQAQLANQLARDLFLYAMASSPIGGTPHPGAGSPMHTGGGGTVVTSSSSTFTCPNPGCGYGLTIAVS